MKFLLSVYLKIRKITSPIIYWLMKRTKYKKVTFPKKWEKVKDYDAKEFERILLEYPYRWDLGKGLIDSSLQEPDFFFIPRKEMRDCDDFARMWFLWAKNKNYPVYEIVTIRDNKIRTAHVITVFEMNGVYRLANYQLDDKKYMSLENAVLASVNNKDKRNLIWKIYKTR
jgi:hypothetical protein